MKKFLILIVAFIMAMGFVGCAPTDDGVIDIYLPDGAPALALVSVFDKTEIGGQEVKFTVVPPATINDYIMNGSADLAIVPTNAAAISYNKGKPYKYVSANTYGNLFIVGTESETSLDDLKGKVVGVIGQGQVPELVFRSLLEREGIEYVVSETAVEGKVALRYAQDGGVLMPLIKQGIVKFGLFGEPAVTVALNNIQGAEIIFDIQQLWGGGYPQAGLMAKNSVSDEFISALFALLEQNKDYAKNNPADALQRIKDHMRESTETTVKALTENTVERSNVRLVKAADCKEDVMEMLKKFMSVDSDSVGGKLPDDKFFRTVK